MDGTPYCLGQDRKGVAEDSLDQHYTAFLGFIPYITSLLVDWSQKRTIQGAYGLVVILTTAHLYWLYTSLNKDNAGSGACGYIASAEKNLKTDLLIKAAGFIAGMVFYPPLVEIGVLVAAVFMISGRISLRKENSGEDSKK